MSASKIVAFLAQSFTLPTLPALTPQEKKFALSLRQLLQDFDDKDLTVEEETEQHLDIDEYSVDEELVDAIARDYKSASGKIVRFSKDFVPIGKVEEAVRHYRTPKSGHRTLASMNKQFRFIKAPKDIAILVQADTHGLDSVLHRNVGIRTIGEKLYEWVAEKFSEGKILHDNDLQAKALSINQQEQLVPGFKASQDWITKWKRAHAISSRRITKFVTKTLLRDKGATLAKAKQFVQEVKDTILTKAIPLSAVFNTDQSGFKMEMYGARSLAITGSKTVEKVVGNIEATTHSYTIMPVLFADGHLYPKLFVILQEKNGQLPQKYYRADNLIIKAHTSHMMTKQLMKQWAQEVIAPMSRSQVLMVYDSWSSFKDHETIKENIPVSMNLTVVNIPAKSTADVQPLDVYFFRFMKGFVKKITEYSQLHKEDFLPHRRDNILKVLSEVYWQFCNKQFKDFLRHAWIKSGYLAPPPPGPRFQTPQEICFPSISPQPCFENACTNTHFAYCSYCKNHVCFLHFIEEVHSTKCPQK